jgi:hypothetical protein
MPTGIRQVHDVVRRLIQLTDGGAHRDGLANADLTGEDAERRLGDTEADTRDGLLVTRSLEQVFGGNVLRERSAGEPEVGDPRCARHAWWSSSRSFSI